MDGNDVISLQDYIVVLKRQRWVVLLVAVLVVVAALAASFAQTPIYRASSELTVQPVQTSVSGPGSMITSGISASETDRVLATSLPVAERAAERLGVTTDVASDGVTAETVVDTAVLRIVAIDPDPAQAAAKADAFAQGYLDFVTDEAIEAVVGAGTNVENRIAEIRVRLEELDAAADDARGAAQSELEIERTALNDQLTLLIEQRTQLGDASQAVTGGGSILEPAAVPESPISPRPFRTAALALVLGLLLGVGAAFLRDHVDDVIRDEEDFRRSTGGRPILGRIPRWSDEDGDERLATVVHPNSIVSEAYRELSAGLRFMLVTHGAELGDSERRTGEDLRDASHGRAIMVASANAGEGKTSTAANLAVAAARVGLRTVLVDADLRRSTVHKRFGLGRSTGLCDALLGSGEPTDHVVDVGVENLRVLPAGTIPPNPAELLASPAMRALQYRLQQEADLVIYDSPAVLAVPDALELGRFVDLAILVGRVGITTRRQLGAAIERFGQVGTDLAGTVLNDIDARSDAYYYSYYYVEDTPAGPAAEKGGRRARRAAVKAQKRAAKAGSPPSREALTYDSSQPRRGMPPQPDATRPRSDDTDEVEASESLFGRRK